MIGRGEKMLIDTKDKYSFDHKTTLGIQSNPARFQEDCILMAKNWAPKKAKSFTIDKVIHTDYDRNVKRKVTGYATIVVSYYSSVKEGENSLVVKIDKALSTP